MTRSGQWYAQLRKEAETNPDKKDELMQVDIQVAEIMAEGMREEYAIACAYANRVINKEIAK